MKKFLSWITSFAVVTALVLNALPIAEFPSFAAAGDWKPDGEFFPHGTGINRGTATQVQPTSAIGTSLVERTITPLDLRATSAGGHGNEYTCENVLSNPNDKMGEINNAHYFPDGIAYSSFNDYRTEFTESFDPSHPPSQFFDSANSNEVERNYFGGGQLNPTTPAEGASGTNNKDTITITHTGATEDAYLKAYIHNNASTALNPTTGDPRAVLSNSTNHPFNISARATNTRMHVSIPSLALPAGQSATTVNRLRADNAYAIADTNSSAWIVDPCAQLREHQISDIAHIQNSTSGPITFSVTQAYIKNPFSSVTTNFTAEGKRALVDPTINQSGISDPRVPAEMTATQGALLSSGRSDIPENRAIPRQTIDDEGHCGTPELDTTGYCNAYANPQYNSDHSQFDGEWYGSTEFSRDLYLRLNAVPAQPTLSVNKSVRREVPNNENFSASGPTSTTIDADTGEVMYQIMLQNSGNVDLDNVNFSDFLPTGLTPIYTGSDTIRGIITRCDDLGEALDDSSCVDAGYTDLHLSGNYIALNSAALGVSASNPLLRDPDFITSGDITTGGQVIRIRFEMTSACPTTDTDVHNHGVASARSGTVPALVVSTNESTFPQYDPGTPTLTEYQSNWAQFFNEDINTTGLPTTNNTTVTLRACHTTTPHPALQIAKYVRRSSDPSTGFGTGAIMTSVGDGEVEYMVLIDNTGTEDMAYLAFADMLPPELSFVSGSIETEICNDGISLNPCGATQSVNDTVYSASNRILALDSSNFLPNSSSPLTPHHTLRIRWKMSSVCTPYGQTARIANNYALVFGATADLDEATITPIPGTGMPHSPRPYNIDSTTSPTFSSLFPEIMSHGFNSLFPTPTNDVQVTQSNCPPPPPPTVTKSVSTTQVGNSGTVSSSFHDANDVGSAVDFGEQNAAYSVYYRVTVRNTGTVDISNVMLEDRFFFANGTTITPQNVVENLGSQLDTRTVNTSTNVETSVVDGSRKVFYAANDATTNILRFRVPTLRAGETLAFYYTVRLDPGSRTAVQYHRNKVQVCYPQTTPTGVCNNGGSDVAFHQDHPRNNPLSISIIKKVNGHDADEASLTATNDQAAVQVVNGDALHYEVTIRADSTNTDVVTGIVLTDTIATLPNVTSISNVVLRTPRGECHVTAGCSIRADHINEDLATHAFDLGATDAPATLTYDAVAHYTDGGTFNQNIARAVPRNAAPKQNPATIIVRNSTLTIIKTVNGHDADTDSDAVTVNNGGELNYVITITAPSGNASTVTGIVLSDDVATLPNISNVRTIRLTTPSGTCATPCTVASISALSGYSFDLAAGQHATLTYTATGVNTTATLSAHNVNTVTATPTHTSTNPGPVHNPATVFVRGTSTPHTDFRITKEANPTVTRDGDEVTYTILVEPRNNHNDEIDNLVLVITDDINETGRLEQGGVTFTYIRGSTRIRTNDASCDGEMNDPDGIRCEDVSADDEIRITYRVRVSAPGLSGTDIVVVDNTAKLRSDTPGVRIRDDDDAEVQVIAPPAPPEQERAMEITKNVDVRTVRRGDLAHYTITVHNPNDHDVVRTLTDTIGLNGGTVPGQNGGRVRFNPGSLQLSGAQFSGSIDTPEGMVLVIPANGLVTITYTATGEPDANQRVISLAPNTARLDTGEYATAFVELPKTGPEAMAMTAFGSLIASAGYYWVRRKKK